MSLFNGICNQKKQMGLTKIINPICVLLCYSITTLLTAFASLQEITIV